ncbi:MAG: hypothetical protein CMI70_02900 [Candidatus Pelagibacter sp.]|jgi:glycosyltransferase involved in cell wall biosynthesis|nr:hypothetical protein [Candidatus Pelagibacter sp.]|tara:strand:+ start:7051 stop:7767 length:717 start_codon:yes stop_codon:yes gene_type:complete
MKISVILLAHNEEKNIGHEIDLVKENILDKLEDYEFIVVEDGSIDKTKEIILEKKKKLNFIYSTSDKRRGVKNAMLESFRISSGDYIFFTDCGKKFDFKDFWKLFGLINKYDLISGLRTSRKDQFYRIILTKIFNYFLNVTLKSKYKDIDSGFKIFNRKALQKATAIISNNSNFLSAEICLKIQYYKFKFIEVPINYYQRNEVSKALPLYKIPKLIFNFLINFFELRKQLKKINSTIV